MSLFSCFGLPQWFIWWCDDPHMWLDTSLWHLIDSNLTQFYHILITGNAHTVDHLPMKPFIKIVKFRGKKVLHQLSRWLWKWCASMSVSVLKCSPRNKYILHIQNVSAFPRESHQIYVDAQLRFITLCFDLLIHLFTNAKSCRQMIWNHNYSTAWAESSVTVEENHWNKLVMYPKATRLSPFIISKHRVVRMKLESLFHPCCFIGFVISLWSQCDCN